MWLATGELRSHDFNVWLDQQQCTKTNTTHSIATRDALFAKWFLEGSKSKVLGANSSKIDLVNYVAIIARIKIK